MKKVIAIMVLAVLFSCKQGDNARKPKKQVTVEENTSEMSKNLDKYVPFKLTSDVSLLSENERKMLPLLIEAASKMNELFWYEAYGDKNELLSKIEDEETKKFVEINYGPWDRLNGNTSFVEGIGTKPLGANYYPADITKAEFEAFTDESKSSLYTFVRRNEDGSLKVIPYKVQFEAQVKEVSDLLLEASKLAEDAGLKKYLELRSQAFLTDDYQPSDFAWMEMKTNRLDIVVGPIETYEDQLFGNKASHEGYVLIKDMEWSKKLEKFAQFLPELQVGLPVDDAYKQEKPGTDSELNAYDVVYYAGDCNAGSKTIAINLPNDEEVQLKNGSRRLQLKNAMRAKFDKILIPISNVLIEESQRKHIKFDAFFANTMFHEVAHGLGIKNTINGKGTVRSSLKELASALEEGKADILGLYMVQQLHKKGEIDGDMKDYMTTFMAGIFRSVRFGASSAHGKANMIRFNFFKEKGAFSKNEDGTYKVDYDKMEVAMKDLSNLILTLQGNGDYDGVLKLVEEKGIIPADLQADLDKLSEQNIPVDVIFEQGVEALGL
ncbi:Zn-dependent hydrolase [Lutibacter sp. TH_r2]|uniref:dipeptidyl-peptidase 3 family protein n=1 Tax=Lutibacter sp. TH_r2 TaxID=3082083 RepID=UPI002952FC67|nr:Zn-dependent hydrolase [Lutibacter sp. TH_r2]MDV7187083.1 Zn-dependent hydrolase [Lutibacter sp. TH_r2]